MFDLSKTNILVRSELFIIQSFTKFSLAAVFGRANSRMEPFPCLLSIRSFSKYLLFGQ